MDLGPCIYMYRLYGRTTWTDDFLVVCGAYSGVLHVVRACLPRAPGPSILANTVAMLVCSCSC